MRVLFVAVLMAVIAACAASEGEPEPAARAPVPVQTTVADPNAAEATAPAPTDPESPPTTLAPLVSLAYESRGELGFPIILTARPGDGLALVGERRGVVRSFVDGEIGDVVLDISDRTATGGERGFLGLVRHPTDDGRLFAHYSGGDGRTVVSEFSFDGSTAGDEEILLEVAQPANNHNGGMVQFGPDGALYLGLGDGGGAGDRFGHGQNTDTLLGGLVQIDVDTGEARLWQYGLRNPWRFWIDGDDIWIADVGQGAYEEVNLAPLAEEGLNYGWPILEGFECFGAPQCDTDGLTMPVIDIAHGDAGTCSITGGVVYGGQSIPELQGRFLFSDYCGGYLRSVDASGEVIDHTDEVGVPGRVVSFGVDGDGEVYVLTEREILALVARR